MRRLVLVLALCVCTGVACAEGNLELSGSLVSETSLRVEGMNYDLSKFKNILTLAGQYKIKDDELVFFVKGRYWYDAAYAWRDKLDIAQHYMEHTQRNDWLRDCYLDYLKNPWFLRLGKQQVVWGQADGIAILDRVNPVDLSEYWLPDLADIRIPLWMANINYAPKLNSNMQFLIIPDFEQSTSAPIGAPFTTYSYTRYNDWRKAQKSVNENIYFPGQHFDNSTFGFQWSDRIGDLAYTLNFLDGYYYSARNNTIFLSGNPRVPATSNWKVDRSFKRWRMYGSSFNKTVTNPGPLQGFTFRGDFAYYDNEPMYYGDPLIASSSGIKPIDNIFWLLGADRYIFTKLLVSGQFAQYVLQHSKPNGSTPQKNYWFNPYTYGAQDPVENIFSLKLSTTFMNDRLKPEVLWSFTDDNQGRLSPKITYELKDNLWITLGIHYFYGSIMDSNGQYRDESQLYTNVKYAF
jgi:hypothetical protein